MSWWRNLLRLGGGGSQSAGLKCPKCGLVIEADLPQNATCICAECKAVFKIRNYQIDTTIAARPAARRGQNQK